MFCVFRWYIHFFYKRLRSGSENMVYILMLKLFTSICNHSHGKREKKRYCLFEGQTTSANSKMQLFFTKIYLGGSYLKIFWFTMADLKVPLVEQLFLNFMVVYRAIVKIQGWCHLQGIWIRHCTGMCPLMISCVKGQSVDGNRYQATVCIHPQLRAT